MSRWKHLEKQRNQKIKDAYAKLAAEKIGNQQKYRHLAILEILSPRFFLAPQTIENILGKSEDDEANPNQLNLFK